MSESCPPASPVSDQPTQPNNRDAPTQRPVRRGHHQHAIVVGRRHWFTVIVANYGACVGNELLAFEVPRRQYHKLLESALTGEADFTALEMKRPVTGAQALAQLAT